MTTIARHHSLISRHWKEYCADKNVALFNQKNRKVYEILVDSTISEAIIKYQDFLVSEITSTDIAEQLEKLGASNSRIKGRNSIENKIDSYVLFHNEKGHSSIKKCLNDIWGIRIITEEKYTIEEIRQLIKSNQFVEKVRVIESIKADGAYNALHVYFSYDNRAFDCELQIWYKEFAETNELSHREHKQQYTWWESTLKEEFDK